MVAFAVVFGFCYSCDAVAVCTRGLNFRRERIVKQIGFIFGTVVAGCKWSGLGVCWRRGGWPSTVATIMVRVFRARISYGGSRRRVYRGRSTTEKVLPFRTIHNHI